MKNVHIRKRWGISMNKDKKEFFYETTDFSELIKKSKGKINRASKRITINISNTIYEEANELDNYMQMGYQNVLKTAMSLGITELYNQVSKHKIKDTKEMQSTSRRARMRKPVPKKQNAYRKATRNKV